MARYRRVYAKFWTDPNVRALNEPQKLLALYCMTSPQANRIGLFNFSIPMAIDHLGSIGIPEINTRLLEVCAGLGWHYDSDARVLWIPTWWKHNPPCNWSHLLGNLKDLDEVTQSPLTQRFIDNIEGLDPSLIDRYKTHVAHVSGGCATPLSYCNSNSKSICKSKKATAPQSDTVSDADVDRVWFEYPKDRRLAKKAAVPHIRAAIRKVGLESLIAKLQAYAKSREGEDSQFTPYPQKWFKNERWNDEPTGKTKTTGRVHAESGKYDDWLPDAS